MNNKKVISSETSRWGIEHPSAGASGTNLNYVMI
jgi:hypothetical protein